MERDVVKKMKRIVFSCTTVSLCVFIFLTFGFTETQGDKLPTYQLTGKVESLSTTQLTLIHAARGYFSDVHNFIINDKTVISGTVRPGVTVTVTYTLKKVDNRMEKKTAVLIQVIETTAQKR